MPLIGENFDIWMIYDCVYISFMRIVIFMDFWMDKLYGVREIVRCPKFKYIYMHVIKYNLRIIQETLDSETINLIVSCYAYRG